MISAENLLRLGLVTLYRGGHRQTSDTLKIGNRIDALGLRDCLNQPKELLRRLRRNVTATDDPQPSLSALDDHANSLDNPVLSKQGDIIWPALA